ncbi:MAG: class I SAM-dependent methyltransferase [Desulfuromonadaceae bacterium]
MKLHLGCGGHYLQGYVNIDFPLPEHSVQEKSVADLHANILDLSYPACSIEEIRLHHVFEHFPRQVACALLVGWFSWLKTGGILHIEVPDFQKTACVMLSPLISFKKKAVAERHLFGSHEAHWAVHCEGYTPDILKNMLRNFGFRVIRFKKSSWLGTYNFELVAEKATNDISKNNFSMITSNYLKKYLLDEGESETRLFNVWLNKYIDQVEKSWANNV